MRFLIATLLMMLTTLSCSTQKAIKEQNEAVAIVYFVETCLSNCNLEVESEGFKPFCICLCERMSDNVRAHHPQSKKEVSKIIQSYEIIPSQDQVMSCVGQDDRQMPIDRRLK